MARWQDEDRWTSERDRGEGQRWRDRSEDEWRRRFRGEGRRDEWRAGEGRGGEWDDRGRERSSPGGGEWPGEWERERSGGFGGGRSGERGGYGGEAWRGEGGSREREYGSGLGMSEGTRGWSSGGMYGGMSGGMGQGAYGGSYGSGGFGGYGGGQSGSRGGYEGRERWGERDYGRDYGREWGREPWREGRRFGGEDQGPFERMGEKMKEGLRKLTGRGPKGYKRSDERIREDVSERIARSAIDADDVEVRVESGVVTLTGFVQHRDDKRALEDIADDVFGVDEVQNQLRIRRETGMGTTAGTSQGQATGTQQGQRTQQGSTYQPGRHQ
jgi:hypothetical protein